MRSGKLRLLSALAVVVLAACRPNDGSSGRLDNQQQPGTRTLPKGTTPYRSFPMTITMLAARLYNPTTKYDGGFNLPAAGSFTIPAEVYVAYGNAGNGYLVMQFDNDSCIYKGGANVANPLSNPEDPDQIAAGQKFNFIVCKKGTGDAATLLDNVKRKPLSYVAGQAIPAARKIKVEIHASDTTKDTYVLTTIQVAQWNQDAPISHEDIESNFRIFAAKVYDPAATYDNTYLMPRPATVYLPKALSVLSGNAGNGLASVTLDDTTCVYKGGSSLSSPLQPPKIQKEINKGKTYKLVLCKQELGEPSQILASATPAIVLNAERGILVKDRVSVHIEGSDYTESTLVRGIFPTFYDVTVPTIAVGAAPPALTNISTLSLSITVTEEAGASTTIFVNDQPAHSSEEKIFTAHLSLVEGNNVIRIESIDDYLNEATPLIFDHVVLDTVQPQIGFLQPTSGQVFEVLSIPVSGAALEPLSSAKLNGAALLLSEDKLGFSGTYFASGDGSFDLNLELTDLAGNIWTEALNVTVIQPVLFGNLISVMPDLSGRQVRIIGASGAVQPGVTVSASAGIFNNGSAVASDNGSFQIILEAFQSATVRATNLAGTRTDTSTVYWGASSTTILSGTVRDTDNTPLVGVAVSIAGSTASGATDLSGMFSISNPPTGDQTLVVDGSTLGEIFIGNGTKKYSSTRVALTIGVAQNNVISRPIYLAPTILDGTQTQIDISQGAVVESPHAPGVVLDIPAGVTSLPTGEQSGAISVSKISADYSTTEVPQMAVPSNVYAFEPSGTHFSQPVELTHSQ